MGVAIDLFYWNTILLLSVEEVDAHLEHSVYIPASSHEEYLWFCCAMLVLVIKQ